MDLVNDDYVATRCTTKIGFVLRFRGTKESPGILVQRFDVKPLQLVKFFCNVTIIIFGFGQCQLFWTWSISIMMDLVNDDRTTGTKIIGSTLVTLIFDEDQSLCPCNSSSSRTVAGDLPTTS